MELRGRTALVTGGAVRVGRAISLVLAGAGARVVVHYNASEEPALRLLDEIRERGGSAEAVQADLRRHDAVTRLAAEVEERWPVDLLVNNASTFPPEGLADVTRDLWEETIAVNLRAPFFLTQRLGSAMRARGGGVIVNLGDLAGIQTWSGYAAHSISKAGLLHLTRVAARALAPEVRVVAVAPGTVLPPDDMDTDTIESLAARTPLRRIGSPEDVASAVLYLATADFVTGEVLVLDGGRLLR
jgi:NAD(P)-dependent dehydrogenase (short-subunit alcohol dehydrogenase family)